MEWHKMQDEGNLSVYAETVSCFPFMQIETQQIIYYQYDK